MRGERLVPHLSEILEDNCCTLTLGVEASFLSKIRVGMVRHNALCTLFQFVMEGAVTNEETLAFYGCRA